MILREARTEDAEAFVHAHEQAWDATLAPIVGKRLGELAPFDARVASFRAGLAAGRTDARAFVAEREGEIVGVATAVAGELRDLYVVPDAWGTGVARELMHAALDFLRAAGGEDAILWVGAANARARRFYEREGWTADGGERNEGLGPEVRYRRPLAEESA
jgi:GNAT superfamily N-acetyltransferase